MPEIKLRVSQDVVTSLEPVGWLCPLKYPPPRGKKIQLLTYTGVATMGTWDWCGFIAWAPCLKIEGEIRGRVGKMPNWDELRQQVSAQQE